MLKCFTNETAKPPRGIKRKKSGSRQLSLWNTTFRSISKVNCSLDEHSLREIAPLWTNAVIDLDLPDVKALEIKCQDVSESICSSASRICRTLKEKGLHHPSDVAAYLVLRELDDKGQRDVPEFRLKVIDFGITSLVKQGK
ncbi:hypothetical protein [Solidesulfovibrio magneticus]|nr:hypothetical protein [Solidesulfovibrio magneticus]